MGTFYRALTVLSADGNSEETVAALVDTGASYTSLPASMLRRLGIAPTGRMEFELANGAIIEQNTGEARVRVDGVEAASTVIFCEEHEPILLGAETLEGASLVVDPTRQRLFPASALRM